MTCHELAGLLSLFFQMFVCASHVTVLMLFCCIASRWLNLYWAHNRFSVYMCHLNCWVFFCSPCTILFIVTLVLVIQLLSYVLLCNPMDCSTPGLPVPYRFPEFAQFHVHWIGDAFQPSHPLLHFSPVAINLSQHQGLFQWVSRLHQVVKVLELRSTTTNN